MNRYDERDTIFSRLELQKGSSEYDDYYQRHPERQILDDAARERAVSQTFTDHIMHRVSVDASFSLLEALRPLACGTKAEKRLTLDPTEASEFLINLAKSYGAVLVGTAPLGEACFYTVRGRGKEYGQPVNPPGKNGIVFAVHMNPEEIHFAPTPRSSAEVVNAYSRLALMGLIIAQTIRAWGWDATCTMDGRADLVLPVAARYAGLGSIGRSGLLLSDDHGPCIRLGAVVTNLPLKRSERQPAKANKLCASCNRCAEACPAKAIDDGFYQDGSFQPVNDDACFIQWQKKGTDCGLCLSHCPLSRIPKKER